MIESLSKRPTTASAATWASINNILVQDATYASITVGGVAPLITASGFDFSAIPDGMAITGIGVRVRCYHTSRGANVTPGLVQTGKTTVTKSVQATPNVTPADLSWGGSTDLWGRTWTKADLTDPSFALTVSANFASGSGNGFVDVVEVTVYYDVPGKFVTDRRPAIIRAATSWTTPINATYEDGFNAFGGTTAGGIANALILSYDLPFPTEAVIHSVEVWIKCYNPIATNTFTVRITQGGTTTTCTEGYRTETTSLQWYGCTFARAFTADQVADPLLQVEILGAGAGGSGNMTGNLYVDQVLIRVVSDHGVTSGYPAAAGNIGQTGTGVAWTTSGTGARLEDTGYMTTNLTSAAPTSQELIGNTLGLNVPTDAQVLGLRWRAKARSTVPAKLQGLCLGVIRETGQLPGTGVAPATPETWVTMASGFKDMWGIAWTPADVNAAGFQPSYRAVWLSGGTAQPVVDAIEVTALYKQAPLAVSFEHDFTHPAELPSSELWWPSASKPPHQAAWISDDFNDGVIAPMWTPSVAAPVTMTEQAATGTLDFTCATTAPTGGSAVYGPAHDARQMEYTIRIDQRANLAGYYLILYLISNLRSNCYYEIRYMNGTTDVARTVDGAAAVMAAATSTAPTHLRIWTPDGGIYFYYTTGTAEQVRLGTATWIFVAGDATAAIPLANAYCQITASKTGAAGAAATFKVGDFTAHPYTTGGTVADRFLH